MIIVYTALSRVLYDERTERMALHPDLPNVPTDLRERHNRRPYRMVYRLVLSNYTSAWYASCLGKDGHLSRGQDPGRMDTDEAIQWLLKG